MLVVKDIMTRRIDEVGFGHALGDVAALMARARISSVIVTDGGRLAGIVTERDVLRAMSAGKTPDTQVADVMSAPVITVLPQLDCREAYQLARRNGVRHLAVAVAGGPPVGIVTEADFRYHVQLMLAADRHEVAQVMDMPLWSLDPHASLAEALALMEHRQATCVVVADGRWPLGIVTEHDVVRLYCEGAGDLMLADVMTSPVICVEAGTPLREAASLMLERRIRHLVVVDGEGLIAGLLTERGLMRPLEIDIAEDVWRERQKTNALLEEHRKHLEHLAHYDTLTLLPNRALLADRLQLAIGQAQRSGQMLAVCCLDLDDFNVVNDSLGHEAGDLLLVEVAKRLKGTVRSGDTASRLGGDEFALLLCGIENFEECERALARIFAALASPFELKGGVANVSASIGVSVYPQDDANPDTLLRHADQAMYRAKQAGRNRYHLYDPEHDRRARAQREAFERIEAALRLGEFRLYFQPKVDIRRGKVIGAEALIRWLHPERGLVAPADFLPVIEDSDFSLTLGDWVIGEALRQMDIWAQQGIELQVSVNISARQLQENTFTERLAAQLAAHPGVAPRLLELEILETAALEDINRVNVVIEACQKLGVSFAIDDFGTGYSSLTYLRRLPARILKIDQSFVRDMLDDPEDLAIVEGVIGLTQAFRREVIAEGVETAQHGRLLMQLGCDQAQGFGIACPMPGDEIPGWIRSYKPDPVWTDAIQLSRDDFPLLAMEVDHNRWIDRLTALLQSDAGPASPPPERECAFGHWYEGPGHARYGALDSFQQLAPLHEAIHRAGREVLDLHQAGRRNEARRCLVELYARRDRLLEQLRAVRVDATLTAPAPA